MMKTSPEDIQNRISELDPEIELLTVEPAGGDVLRLYIDHPQGVNLEMCQSVTRELNELLIDHSLEVSSPGPERPLTKPEHFSRFTGRRAKVRTIEPIQDRINFTGTILEEDGEAIVLGVDEAVVRIPFERVERSHLVPDNAEGAAK